MVSTATEVAAGRLAPSRTLVGLGWAALGVLIFAGWFVVTRLGVAHELRIWDIAALRFGIGALVFIPVLLHPRSRLPLAAWRRGFLFMLLWGVPFVLCVALGLQLTSAGQAASITPTLMPVFAGLFAWLFAGEPQGPARWGGFAAILLGQALLLATGSAVHGAPDPAGIAALAVAAAMWATYTLLFRRSHITAAQSAAMICVWSALLYLPPYLLLGLGRFAQASPGEIALQAGYQGVLMSNVAIVVFNRAVTLLGPGAATAIIALLPAVATTLAIPVLGEVPTAAEASAIAVIVAGALLAARLRSPSATSPPRTEGESG